MRPVPLGIDRGARTHRDTHVCPRHGLESCGGTDPLDSRCGFPLGLAGKADVRYHACVRGPDAWIDYEGVME
jgi:hypothetical protein